MENTDRYAVIAIPLSRPEIVDFLIPPSTKSRGEKLQVVGQRATPEAESKWIKVLLNADNPTVHDLLTIDDPHSWLVQTATDRLVPVHELDQPNFLTRDLGGWVANYFGVARLSLDNSTDDPLLKHIKILTDYGPRIRYFGADPDQVQAHLEEEMDGDVKFVASALGRIEELRRQWAGRPMDYIDKVYAEIAGSTCFSTADSPPIPKMLLYDELISQLVRLELSRRSAVAEGDSQLAERISAWQQAHEEASGLHLILQGEYIVGRHRRSTVLIAPELGVVVKQPAPEPLHDIDLGAEYVQGRNENWPVTVNGGALIMPRGRIRLTYEEGIIPRLSDIFDHHICFSLLLGLTVEPHVVGKTVQDWVLEDHGRLTTDLYEEIVLHQQVCEILEVDNNDWHAPNFVRRDTDGRIVHIDWGAARPLTPDEFSPEAKLARLNQVSNMAFSFKIKELAVHLKSLHHELTNDRVRMAGLRQRAIDLVENS